MPDERLQDLKNLEEILGYKFENIALLDNALRHRSFVNENPGDSLPDNERLEFLGDAVLGLCLSDMLIRKFPDYAEGQLSKLRAFVVNEQSLADIARRFEIGAHLLLGRGEEGSGGRTKASILSNAFEAVAAAVYLDCGFEKACRFLERIFQPLIDEGKKSFMYRDYKTALQEICQNLFKETPKYTLINETGPDHDKVFEISLRVGGILAATGKGKSKKEAEQQAAGRALEELAKRRDASPASRDE